MKTEDTIPKIRYGIFKRTDDGLLKVPENYKNERFTTIERAAQFVFDSQDSSMDYLILPIASWKWKE